MAGSQYLVTARKYRPQVFEDLVAQSHVVQTLINALKLGRLAHAYLFTGLAVLEKQLQPESWQRPLTVWRSPTEKLNPA